MKKYFLILLLFSLFIPNITQAQTDQVKEDRFEAKVLEILAQEDKVTESGNVLVQQNIRIKGLTGNWKDEEMIVTGVSDVEVVSAPEVSKGDKVVVGYSKRADGNEVFVVVDHVRRGWIYMLALFFAVCIVVVGKTKGFKALISLIITFFVIMKFIIPQIMMGRNPMLVSLIGSLVILALVIYFTWGWKMKAHIAMISILISLFVTGLISILFTNLTKLSGMTNDEILYLVGHNGATLDFKGLLLAAIIIGTLGVLDDVVISQISTIEQIRESNPNLSRKELYKKGMKVGIDHISSMTNTLFLAYAGAAMPLLMLFTIRQEPFVTYSQVINNEMIATEIVRTLTGSIGLILAVPIATLFAVKYLKKEK